MPASRSSRPAATARAKALEAAGYVCQLRIPGVCIGAAPLVAYAGVPAGELAHLVPVAVDPSREWDPTNHRAACRPCNRHQGAELLHRPPTQPSHHWRTP